MKGTARIGIILTTSATLALVCGGYGSAVSAPADAPTRASAAIGAPSGRPGVAPVGAPVVLLGTPALPQGLTVPPGARPAKTVRSFVRGELRGWETTADLGPVAVDAALGSLRRQLAALGFDLRAGSHDLFGVRQRDGRWEIVVARAEHRGHDDAARDVLTIGVGSRPL